MFQIKFSEEQLSFILNLVAERPFKEVHEIVDSIRTQAQEQIAQAQAAQTAQQASEVDDAPKVQSKK